MLLHDEGSGRRPTVQGDRPDRNLWPPAESSNTFVEGDSSHPAKEGPVQRGADRAKGLTNGSDGREARRTTEFCVRPGRSSTWIQKADEDGCPGAPLSTFSAGAAMRSRRRANTSLAATTENPRCCRLTSARPTSPRSSAVSSLCRADASDATRAMPICAVVGIPAASCRLRHADTLTRACARITSGCNALRRRTARPSGRSEFRKCSLVLVASIAATVRFTSSILVIMPLRQRHARILQAWAESRKGSACP